MKTMKRWIFAAAAAVAALMAEGTSVEWYESADGDYFRRKKVKTATSASAGLTLPAITGSEEGTPFAHWGTTFNELDWDAFLALDRADQDRLMHSLFAPDGDLRFTRGRIGMNCNDYGRSWFSCDEVPGDLELRYFNIERDKRGIIPLIRAAQHFNPSLTFWASPWSPPSWMKINGDYPVVSSRHNSADPRIDYLLFGATDSIDEDEMKFLGPRDGKFPRRLATTDYFIQDPRYLQAYADYFCRFIEEYAAQGVPIDMVIYQNEAYSYTPLSGLRLDGRGYHPLQPRLSRPDIEAASSRSKIVHRHVQHQPTRPRGAHHGRLYASIHARRSCLPVGRARDSTRNPSAVSRFGIYLFGERMRQRINGLGRCRAHVFSHSRQSRQRVQRVVQLEFPASAWWRESLGMASERACGAR